MIRPFTPNVQALCVSPSDRVRTIISVIDTGVLGLALVCDAEGALIDTITDGDVRRGILAGVTLEDPAEALCGRKGRPPVTASVETDDETIVAEFGRSRIRHLPLLDGRGRVRDLAVADRMGRNEEGPRRAMVMAGGFGKRLLPLTRETPKPMLPVEGRPMLEHVLEKLRADGVREFCFSTHHLPEKIRDHFGDGHRFGVDIEYVHEDEPLGTAGALGLMSDFDDTLLMMNGDVLSDVNFSAMLRFHRQENAVATVAAQIYEHHVPFGVLDLQDVAITGVTEKPTLRRFVSAGIYLLEPRVLFYIRANVRLDMPQLLLRLVEEGERVCAFPLHESWLDVGRPEDYARADRLNAS